MNWLCGNFDFVFLLWMGWSGIDFSLWWWVLLNFSIEGVFFFEFEIYKGFKFKVVIIGVGFVGMFIVVEFFE